MDMDLNPNQSNNKNDAEIYSLKMERDKLNFTILTINEENLKLKALIESLKQENEILSMENEYFNKIKKCERIERDDLVVNLEAEKRKNKVTENEIYRNKCLLDKNHELEDKNIIDSYKDENSKLNHKLMQ